MKIFPKGRRFESGHFYSPILIFAPGNEPGGHSGTRAEGTSVTQLTQLIVRRLPESRKVSVGWSARHISGNATHQELLCQCQLDATSELTANAKRVEC